MAIQAREGTSKRATVTAFNELLPRVEQGLAKRGILEYKSVTNFKMARFLERNHGVTMEPHKNRHQITKTPRRRI